MVTVIIIVWLLSSLAAIKVMMHFGLESRVSLLGLVGYLLVGPLLLLSVGVTFLVIPLSDITVFRKKE